VVVLVETEAWLNTVANRKEQSGFHGTASGGADETVQQMNRTLDVFRPRGYDSFVVKVKNLKGGRGHEKDPISFHRSMSRPVTVHMDLRVYAFRKGGHHGRVLYLYRCWQ